MKRTLLTEMVAIYQAQENCRKFGDEEWYAKHTEHLQTLANNLPSGSGFDSGTEILLLSSTKAVFETSFHHMDEAGGYDGWTNHIVTVRPTFTGLDIAVSGRNRNGIKEYIAEEFLYRLEQEVTEDGRLVSLVEASRKWQEGIANGTIV